MQVQQRKGKKNPMKLLASCMINGVRIVAKPRFEFRGGKIKRQYSKKNNLNILIHNNNKINCK